MNHYRGINDNGHRLPRTMRGFRHNGASSLASSTSSSSMRDRARVGAAPASRRLTGDQPAWAERQFSWSQQEARRPPQVQPSITRRGVKAHSQQELTGERVTPKRRGLPSSNVLSSLNPTRGRGVQRYYCLPSTSNHGTRRNNFLRRGRGRRRKQASTQRTGDLLGLPSIDIPPFPAAMIRRPDTPNNLDQLVPVVTRSSPPNWSSLECVPENAGAATSHRENVSDARATMASPTARPVQVASAPDYRRAQHPIMTSPTPSGRRSSHQKNQPNRAHAAPLELPNYRSRAEDEDFWNTPTSFFDSLGSSQSSSGPVWDPFFLATNDSNERLCSLQQEENRYHGSIAVTSRNQRNATTVLPISPVDIHVIKEVFPRVDESRVRNMLRSGQSVDAVISLLADESRSLPMPVNSPLSRIPSPNMAYSESTTSKKNSTGSVKSANSNQTSSTGMMSSELKVPPQPRRVGAGQQRGRRQHCMLSSPSSKKASLGVIAKVSASSTPRVSEKKIQTFNRSAGMDGHFLESDGDESSCFGTAVTVRRSGSGPAKNNLDQHIAACSRLAAQQAISPPTSIPRSEGYDNHFLGSDDDLSSCLDTVMTPQSLPGRDYSHQGFAETSRLAPKKAASPAPIQKSEGYDRHFLESDDDVSSCVDMVVTPRHSRPAQENVPQMIRRPEYDKYIHDSDSESEESDSEESDSDESDDSDNDSSCLDTVVTPRHSRPAQVNMSQNIAAVQKHVQRSDGYDRHFFESDDEASSCLDSVVTPRHSRPAQDELDQSIVACSRLVAQQTRLAQNFDDMDFFESDDESWFLDTLAQPTQDNHHPNIPVAPCYPLGARNAIPPPPLKQGPTKDGHHFDAVFMHRQYPGRSPTKNHSTTKTYFGGSPNSTINFVF